MRVTKPSFSFEEDVIDGLAILKKIERAGRTCYKSEDKITGDSAIKFVKMVLKRGHHSVIEHHSISVRVICDRGVSHEWVRHRLASYSQESTRYCNYSKDKFGSGITVIEPEFKDPYSRRLWESTMVELEASYREMLAHGESPQIARSILPNSLKTEFVCTMNLREWRHFFTLRTPDTAHPQIREIARPLLAEFRKLIPVLFDDVGTLGEK